VRSQVPSSTIANATPKTHSRHKIVAVMKNVLMPLTPVSSLFSDAASSAGDDGIGEVLAACIHRYDRLEVADAIEACKLAGNRHPPVAI